MSKTSGWTLQYNVHPKNHVLYIYIGLGTISPVPLEFLGDTLQIRDLQPTSASSGGSSITPLGTVGRWFVGRPLWVCEYWEDIDSLLNVARLSRIYLMNMPSPTTSIPILISATMISPRVVYSRYSSCTCGELNPGLSFSGAGNSMACSVDSSAAIVNVNTVLNVCLYVLSWWSVEDLMTNKKRARIVYIAF